MKMIALSAALAATTLAASAETFVIDTTHAEIGFAAKHMMVSNTKGKFNTFEGTIEYDLATKTLKSAECVIQAESIDTNNEKRDGHLKNEDFFNVGKFPKLVFKSTHAKKTGENEFELAGTLNVLGVDRPVILPVVISGPVDGYGGGKVIGFAIETKLNRRALGIEHSPAAVIGDEVKINVDVEAVLKK